MNLHEVLMEMGSKHSHIKNKGYSDLLSFNLKEKSIKNGKIILMQNGNIIPQKINFADGREIELEDDLGDTEEEFFNGLEERFIEYYLSCPTESDRFVRSNFVSKAGDKLTYEEFMKGGNRNDVSVGRN